MTFYDAYFWSVSFYIIWFYIKVKLQPNTLELQKPTPSIIIMRNILAPYVLYTRCLKDVVNCWDSVCTFLSRVYLDIRPRLLNVHSIAQTLICRDGICQKS